MRRNDRNNFLFFFFGVAQIVENLKTFVHNITDSVENSRPTKFISDIMSYASRDHL